MNYDIHEWNIYGYPGEYLYGNDTYVDEYFYDERWLPITGFDDLYWVSNRGRVWSIRNRMFLKVKPLDNHGHYGVCLYKDGVRYYRYIHRLVADAFIPNPDNYPVVRHVYDDPYYNEVDDLTWGTQADNIRDSIRNGKSYRLTDEDREKSYSRSRTPIIAINLHTYEETYFKSQADASRCLSISQSNIYKVLNRERSRAGDYSFKYANREVL